MGCVNQPQLGVYVCVYHITFTRSFPLPCVLKDEEDISSQNMVTKVVCVSKHGRTTVNQSLRLDSNIPAQLQRSPLQENYVT
jgi:hypothetical protein